MVPLRSPTKRLPCAVEYRAGGHAHALGIDREFAGRIHAVHRPLRARGHKEIAIGIESQAGGVEDAGDKGGAAPVRADADHRDRRGLAALAGDGGVDHARAAHGRAGDGVQAGRSARAPRAAERRCWRRAGCALPPCRLRPVRARGKPGARPAHDHVRRGAIHQHRGRAEAVRAQVAAGQLHFAQRQRGGRDARRQCGARGRSPGADWDAGCAAWLSDSKSKAAITMRHPKHTTLRQRRRKRCPSPRAGFPAGGRERAW